MDFSGEIKRRILECQRQSLADVAGSLGLEIEQLTRLRLELTNEEAELRRRAFLRRDEPGSAAVPLELGSPICSAPGDDFWTYCESCCEDMRRTAISLIVRALPQAIPPEFDWRRSELCHEIERRESLSGAASDLTSLLSNIPVVFLSDQDFDPFGSGDDGRIGATAVRFHMGAGEALRLLSRTLVYSGSLGRDENTPWPVRTYEVAFPRRSGDIIDRLAEVFRGFLAGTSILTKWDDGSHPRQGSWNRETLAMKVSMGAELALWLRSYARIVLLNAGQISRPHPGEAEVDALATLALCCLPTSEIATALTGNLMLYCAMLALWRVKGGPNVNAEVALDNRLELVTACASSGAHASGLKEEFRIQRLLLAPLEVFERVSAGLSVEEACEIVYQKKRESFPWN
jgi:hypothetical protein